MSYHPKPHQSPAWSIKGSAYIALPEQPTRWELFLLEENIEEKDFKSNPKVLEFLQEYADKFYIPTVVLKMYGMDLDM